jgi:hypothetical protein
MGCILVGKIRGAGTKAGTAGLCGAGCVSEIGAVGKSGMEEREECV